MVAEIEIEPDVWEVREMGKPTCGDFCDTCGDCLACYGEAAGRDCEAGLHRWVIYNDRLAERLKLNE